MRDRAWAGVLCVLAAVTVTACAGLVSDAPGASGAGGAENPPTGEGCIPVAMTGAEPLPDAMTGAEPLPDAMTTPDAMTNYF
jgi:hypothetical protein